MLILIAAILRRATTAKTEKIASISPLNEAERFTGLTVDRPNKQNRQTGRACVTAFVGEKNEPFKSHKNRMFNVRNDFDIKFSQLSFPLKYQKKKTTIMFGRIGTQTNWASKLRMCHTRRHNLPYVVYSSNKNDYHYHI